MAPEATAQARLDPWRQYEDGLRELDSDPGGVPILWSAPGARYLIIGAGSGDGVTQGCAVSAGGVFAGIVDAVELALSRVRLLSHESCYYGGSVSRVDRVTGVEEQAARVLLRGMGEDLAATQRGSVLDPDLAGCAVFTSAGEGVPADLLIGHVIVEPRLGLPAVRLSAMPEALDEVTVHARDGSAPLPAPARPLFDALDVEVLCAGDGMAGGRSILIAAGSSDGAAAGTYVSHRGTLWGCVARPGARQSRVAPLSSRQPVDAIELTPGDAEGEGVSARSLRFAGLEQVRQGRIVYARGRRTLAPRGELIAAHEAGGWVLASPWPSAGGRVTVHVFRAGRELARLRRGMDR